MTAAPEALGGPGRLRAAQRFLVDNPVIVLVAVLVAPHQPTLRTWYLQNACPLLDQLSSDICVALRREAGQRV